MYEIANGTEQELMKAPANQGELLEKLRLWTGLSKTAFAIKVGKSRTWYQENITRDRLFHTAIAQICQAFSIPVNYFEGNYILPSKPAYLLSPHEQAGPDMVTIKELKEENESLRKELLEARKKIIDIQDKIIRLTGN